MTKVENLNLREFCNLNLATKDMLHVFREVKIGDTTALLLGVQTYEEEQDGHAVTKTGLYIMYEDEPESDEYEGECYLNRQVLLSSINSRPEPAAARIEEIRINNTVIPFSEVSNECVKWLEFRKSKLLLEAIGQNKLPESWLDLDADRIWIAEYTFDDAWRSDELEANKGEWEFTVSDEEQVYLICKTLTVQVGEDCGQTFGIEIDREEVPVTVRGLEAIEGFEGHLLALAYKTRSDLQLDFYSSRHLDRCSGNGAVGMGLIVGVDDSKYRYSLIDIKGVDPAKPIEIELFSARKIK